MKKYQFFMIVVLFIISTHSVIAVGENFDTFCNPTTESTDSTDYMLYEGFEGTGAPSGWSCVSTGCLWDYTTVKHSGTQSYTGSNTDYSTHPAVTTTGITTYQLWIYVPTSTDYTYLFYELGNLRGASWNDGKFRSITSTQNSFAPYTTSTWYTYVIVVDYVSDNMTQYVYNTNGDLIGSYSDTFTDGAKSNIFSSRHQYSVLDDVRVYSGSICPTSSPDYPYAHVQVTDLYDNSTLSGLTVYLGGMSNTTDGSGIAYFYNTTLYNYTVDGGSDYFNVSGTANENVTSLVRVYGAFPEISLYNVEGNNVLVFNITSPETFNSTTDGSTHLLLPPDTVTEVTVNALYYYVFNNNITTTAKDVSSKNITGAYQTLVKINATNAYTGAALSNFTGWVYNNETGYNVSFNDSGSGTAYVNSLYGLHTIFIDVDDYSMSVDNYDYHNYTTAAYSKTFDLYSNNSILITIRSEETDQLITDNVTVILSGGLIYDTYYTSTGYLFLENITDGNYSIRFSSANYTLRDYSVTVADRSTQQLIAYLSGGSDVVTFTIFDDDTSSTIEGATITQQRLVNGSWTVIGIKNSDVSGRAQFSYTIGIKYRFSVAASGYTSKVFELDPVIYTSYNIRINKILQIEEDIGYFDVSFYYFPTRFIANENNSFTFSISSPGGSLQSYGFTLTYPGGSQSGTGTNSYGSTTTVYDFNITGATSESRVVLTYWYDSVFGDNKTYTKTFNIEGTSSAGTIYDIKNNGFGLGTIDKILIATLFIIIFAGLLTLYGNALLGAMGALILIGFFIIIGFLSVWVTIPTTLVILLVVMRRSTE